MRKILLIIIIKIIIAVIAYILNNLLHLFQYLYRNVVITIFANSKKDAIILTEIAAPINNVEIPIIEYHAAQKDNPSPENSTSIGNVNIFLKFILYKYLGFI